MYIYTYNESIPAVCYMSYIYIYKYIIYRQDIEKGVIVYTQPITQGVAGRALDEGAKKSGVGVGRALLVGKKMWAAMMGDLLVDVRCHICFVSSSFAQASQ